MSTTVYFLIWAAAIFLMMRFGCGAHVTGHGRGKNKHGANNGKMSVGRETLSWIPPDKDVDPVCGKTINTDGAKPSVHDGGVYYFCSRDCREVFEAAPDQYIGSQVESRHSPLENQHV